MSGVQLPIDPLWPRAGNWPEPSGPVDAICVGVPTYRTSISATNAHATPQAIRDALRRYGTHALSSDGRAIDLATLQVADAGDLADPDAGFAEDDAVTAIRRLAADARMVLALGGDNACTVPTALGAWGGDISTAGLVTIDAHHDLRDGISNGSPVRRLIEAGLNPRRVVQIGILDFANSPAYTARAAELGITVIPRGVVESEPISEIAARAAAIAGAEGGPIHLDVDVDVCDRSVAPGCPASAPGGISAFQLRTLVRELCGDSRIRSVDIAEIDALADVPDGRTVRLGALVVLEALAALAGR